MISAAIAQPIPHVGRAVASQLNAHEIPEQAD